MNPRAHRFPALEYTTVIVLALALLAPRRAASDPAQAAPGFALRGLDGKTVRLTDYKGKPVVLDFWATWCGPCRAAMPHLDAIQNRYRERGLVVLGVSVDDGGPQRVKRYADHLGVRFRIVMADERVLDLYGPIRSIPTTFFIDRRGMVVRRVVGYLDQETLESYAEEVLGD